MPEKTHANILLFDSIIFKFLLFGWVAYIVLTPLYIFDSGLPQPADLLVMVFSCIAVGFYILKHPLVFNETFAVFFVMVSLFACVNLMNALIYGDSRFYYGSVYYIFNGLVFGLTILLLRNRPETMLSYARFALITVVIFECIVVLFFNNETAYREAGSFNNPNQLGYWSLLMSACLVVLNTNKRMAIIDIIAILLCGYLVMESLSRAAILSYGLILLFLMCSKNISIVIKSFIPLLITGYVVYQSVVTGLSPMDLISNIDLIERVSARLESDDGAVVERGYDRLVNYPEYLLFGAGEGAHWRFMDIVYEGRELHSGLATILFSYGVLGFVLFSYFIFSIFKRAPFSLWVTLAAIMAYGLTHQHIRFTGFWVYLGLCYGMIHYKKSKDSHA